MVDQAAVLVVDDEPDIRNLYRQYLNDEYVVRTAASGREALDGLDESVDVVLLDRLMPEMSGDEVLEAIRERGYTCPVAMVTAVGPDFDIIEMGFDDYITKPVSSDDLEACIETLLRRREYDDAVQEYYAVAAKIAALEERKSEQELAESREFQSLNARLAVLEERTDALVEETIDADAEQTLYGGI